NLIAIITSINKKVIDSEVSVIESIEFDKPKTKEFRAMLDNMDVKRKALVVLEKGNEFAALSARNIEGVKVVAPNNVSVLDVVAHDNLILTKAALDRKST